MEQPILLTVALIRWEKINSVLLEDPELAEEFDALCTLSISIPCDEPLEYPDLVDTVLEQIDEHDDVQEVYTNAE